MVELQEAPKCSVKAHGALEAKAATEAGHKLGAIVFQCKKCGKWAILDVSEIVLETIGSASDDEDWDLENETEDE